LNKWIAPTKGSFHDGYDVVECRICGGVYADNIPDAGVINEYYSVQSKKAQGYKARDWKEPEGWMNHQVKTKRWITENIDIKNSILDIGSYTGSLMLMFKDEKKVFGYDPSRMGHEVAKTQHGLDTEVAGRFRETSYYKRGMKFSLAIMSHVVEHIADTEVFFEDIRPALEDDGQLYIEVPDITNWFISSDERNCYDHREPMLQLAGEHINFFSPSSLTRMMNRVGYGCVKLEVSEQGAIGQYAIISSAWRPFPKADDAQYIPKYFADSMGVYEKHNAILKNIVSPVYVWGAGGHTQRMMQYSEMGKLDIVAFVESNTDYHGGTLAGRPIISPAEIDQPYPIIVSSLIYQDAIADQIKGMGLKNQIITLYR
jgi:SAM-dependent methyltransferase